MGMTIAKAVEIVRTNGKCNNTEETRNAKRVLMGFYKKKTGLRFFSADAAISHAYRLYQVPSASSKPLKAAVDLLVFEQTRKQLEKLSLTIKRKARDKNSYCINCSVSRWDIGVQLRANGFKIEDSQIITDPIIEFGLFSVRVNLHEKVQAILKVWVVPLA